MFWRPYQVHPCPYSNEREDDFHEDELFYVCKNDIYKIWLGIAGGDEKQGTFIAIGYSHNAIDAFGSRDYNHTKRIKMTRIELEEFMNMAAPSTSTPAFKKFRVAWIGVVPEKKDIPEDDASTLWIAEEDRQKLIEIATQGLRDIDTLQPYMKSSRFYELTTVTDLHVRRVLLRAYHQWISHDSYRQSVPTFATFLKHNGLAIEGDVTHEFYEKGELTNVTDMYNRVVHPSVGWFVHNACCKQCSHIHSKRSHYT